MDSNNGRRHFLKTMGGVAIAATGIGTALTARASAAPLKEDTNYIIRLRANTDMVIGWTLYLNNGRGLALKNNSNADPSILWRFTYIDPGKSVFTIGRADQSDDLMSWSPLHQQCYVTNRYPTSEIVHFIAVPTDSGYVKLARTHYPNWTDVLDAAGNGPYPAETIIYNWSDNGGQNQQWMIEQA